MDWQNPVAFYFLWLVPLWIGLALYARARKRRAAHAFAAAAMHGRLLPRESRPRFWLRTGLWLLFLVFAVLACARPRWGEYYEQVRRRGSDLMVVVDVSRSMLASDVPPTRLERAKQDVKLLLNELKGERVGLIAFAGRAVLACPLTSDHGFFRLALDDMGPHSAPLGGTAIGDAIRKALETMKEDAGRDQAILLITDGEDHESYPKAAAQKAAERKVVIFTVGLGDPEQGARIPGKDPGAFVSHDGQQVWSKMDEVLLTVVAKTTGGAYVPARTRSYDLGKLYADHLSKLRGEATEERKRRRLKDRYQIFLMLSLACLTLHLFIRPHSPRKLEGEPAELPDYKFEADAPADKPLAHVATAGLWLCCALTGWMALASPRVTAGEAPAPVPGEKAAPEESGEPLVLERDRKRARKALKGKDGEDVEGEEAPAVPAEPPPDPADLKRDPVDLVAEGLEAYTARDWDKAKLKFRAADALNGDEPRVAFDLGCVYHQAAQRERATHHYLRAAGGREKAVAIDAQYNLGLLDAEEARRKAGEKPEELAPDKREGVLETLQQAAYQFRQTLRLDPKHAAARKNLELIRLWVKYYTERWRQIDRDKRRQEMDLLKFLEYLIAAQKTLRATTGDLDRDPSATFDLWAQVKRDQSYLAEELPTLREKLEQAVRAPQGLQSGQNPPQPPAEDEQIKQAVEMFNKQVDAVGQAMNGAAGHLDKREGPPAMAMQRDAIDVLEDLWSLGAPFNALLAKALKEQTALAEDVKPDENPREEGGEEKAKLSAEEGEDLAHRQHVTMKRTVLLSPKAQEMIKQLEQAPHQERPQPPPPGPEGEQPLAPPSPEEVRKGLEKAIELAPRAADHQSKAAQFMHDRKADEAYPDAEEARRILEEIEKAQPKNQQQQEQDQESQENQDQQQNQDQQKQDQQKKDQEKQDEEKKDEDEKEKEKKDDSGKKKDEEQQKGKPESQKLNRQQAEAILRKVREREKQRRENLKEMQILLQGSQDVEKDW